MAKYKVKFMLTTPDPDNPLNNSVLEGTMETIVERITIKIDPEEVKNIRHRWITITTNFIKAGTKNKLNPPSGSGGKYAKLWSSPMAAMLKMVWQEFGYDLGKMETTEKYTYVSARAVGYLVVDTFKKLDKEGLTISSLLSLEKTAAYLAPRKSYIQTAIDRSINNGWSQESV